jgi:hypothetical protein
MAMQYFFVHHTECNSVREIEHREFADLETAQRVAVATVRDLIADALLLGKEASGISIEIWQESGGIVSVVQGSADQAGS